jgi:hypothetical protein
VIADQSGGEAPDRDERIKRRAYEIWEREGRPSGRDIEHWQQAEDEIVAEDEGDRAADEAQTTPSSVDTKGTQASGDK